MFTFEKLQIYQLSKELVRHIYSLTRLFPEIERFALVTQLNRAVVSVVSNIAEGSGRSTAKDKAHFINMAYGSLMEVTCQVDIAYDLGYVSLEQKEFVFSFVKNLSVKMSNFVSSLEHS